MICLDDDDEAVTHVLRRSYFGLHQLDFTEAVVDPGGVEFNLPISDWLQLFADSGLLVERFLEVKAPDSAQGEEFGRCRVGQTVSRRAGGSGKPRPP